MPVLTTPDPVPDRRVLASCFDAVRRVLSRCVSVDEAVGSILLRAPAGTVWRVSVDDTGTLVTTQVG